MLLADAQFEQITSALRGGRPAPADPSALVPRQRRREPRVGVDGQITLIPISDSLQIAPFDVPVRDLSPGGIGFLHTRRMSLDEQFVVLLPEGRESVAVLCAVAHYQPLAESWFAIGARFVRVLRQPSGAGGPPRLTLPVAPVPRRAAS